MARILVVDDEEVVRSTIRAVLTQAGHDVVEAADGATALARYREEPADLVLADLFMPVMTGTECIRELRRESPDAKIVAISGAGREMLRLPMDAGANRILSKPFTTEELLRIVEEMLQ